MAAICGGAALGLAAAAAVAAGPTLSVSPADSAFSSAGTTVLRFTDDGLDPTATIEVYAPARYSVELAQPLGSTIGSIQAQAKTVDGTDVRLSGAVRTVEPATYAQAAAACTGTPAHEAVWTLSLSGSGVAVERIPVYVDRVPGATRLRICLPQPGTAGFPVRLGVATLTLNGVFANPSSAGEYRWTSVFTTHSQTGTLESQTIVRLPPKLTLTRKVIQPRGHHRRTFVRLSGRLTENGRPVRGIRVELLSGPSASSLERLAYATSFGRGRFAVVAPLRGKTVFRARAAAPLRTGPLSQCTRLALYPDAICSRLTLAPFTARSRSVTASPPRPGARRRGRVGP